MLGGELRPAYGRPGRRVNGGAGDGGQCLVLPALQVRIGPGGLVWPPGPMPAQRMNSVYSPMKPSHVYS